MTKTSNTDQDTATDITEAMMKLQKAGFGSLTWMDADWMDRMNEMGSQALSFMSERVKEDVAYQQRLMQCRDLKEIQKVHADFLQTAFDQYSKESSKMVELSGDMIRSGMKPD